MKKFLRIFFIATGSIFCAVVSHAQSITVSGAALVAVPTIYGTASPSPTSFTVSGSGLGAGATLLIEPPPGFEVADNTLLVYGTTLSYTANGGGNVSSKTVLVRIANTTVPGTYSGNINLTSGATSQTKATASTVVAKKDITVTGQVATPRNYISGLLTVAITGGTLSGVNFSDNVTYTAASAVGTMANANVGASKTVTITTTGIGGTDLSYYNIVTPTVANVAIGQAPLSILTLTTTKVYDKTLTAAAGSFTGSVTGMTGGDVINLIASAVSGTYANKDAGTGKTVNSVSGALTLSGTQAANYSPPTTPTSISTGVITKVPLTIDGVTVTPKVYDQTNSVTITPTTSVTPTGVLSGEVVTASLTSTPVYSSANAGTSIPINSVTYTLDVTGPEVNYFIPTQPSLSGTINKKPLTVTGLSANKTYDASIVATITGATIMAGGVISGDVVNLNVSGVSGNFGTASAGTGKTVTTSGLYTVDNNNYSITTPSSFLANIATRNLDITPGSITAQNRVYAAGVTSATITGTATLTGVQGSDVVGITGPYNGAFADDAASVTAKPVTVTGYSLTGAAPVLANYTITTPTMLSAFIFAPTSVVPNYSGVLSATTINTNPASVTPVGVLGFDINNPLNTSSFTSLVVTATGASPLTVFTSVELVKSTLDATYDPADPVVATGVLSAGGITFSSIPGQTITGGATVYHYFIRATLKPFFSTFEPAITLSFTPNVLAEMSFNGVASTSTTVISTVHGSTTPYTLKDNIAPTIVSIVNTHPKIISTNLSQIVTATFSEPMDISVMPVVTISAGTWQPQTAGSWSVGNTVYTTTLVHNATPTEDFTVTSNINTLTAKDVGQNTLAAIGASATFELDNIIPVAAVTTVIAAPGAITLGNPALQIRVTYSEPMNTSVAPSVSINGTTSFNPLPAGTWNSPTNTIYTINAVHNGTTFEESATINAQATSIGQDLNGNLPSAIPVNSANFVVDTKRPAFTSIIRVGPQFTSANSAVFTLTFSEVVNIDIADLQLVKTNTVAFTPITGASITTSDNIVYTVTVTGVTGDGDLQLFVNAGATITDFYGNSLIVPGLGFTGEYYTFDHIVPTLNSIVLASGYKEGFTSVTVNGTIPALHSGRVEFIATFSEPVNGVSFSDFTMSSPGSAILTNGTITPETPAPTDKWRIRYNYTSGTGQFSSNFVRVTTTIKDQALNNISTNSLAGQIATVLPGQPSGPVAILTPNATGTNVTVTWTDVTAPVVPTHYLVVLRTTANPTILDGTAIFPDDTNLSDGVMALNIQQGDQSASFGGLTPGVPYNVAIYPYTLASNTINGLDRSAIDYNTTTPARVSRTSDIITDSGFPYTNNIDYATANNQLAAITSNTHGTAMERFILRDGVAAADDDILPTQLGSITLKITNYMYLQRVALINETTGLVVQDRDISFITNTTGITPGSTGELVFNSYANPFVVDDNSTNNLVVRATFIGPGMIDNSIISFQVIAISAKTGSGTSLFINNTPTGILGTNTVDENKIEVTATSLVFTSMPSSVTINVNFAPVIVKALDSKTNIDLDFLSPVSAFGNTDGLTMINTPFTPDIVRTFATAPGTLTLPGNFQFTSSPASPPTQLTISAGALSGTSGDISVTASQESVLTYDAPSPLRLNYLTYQEPTDLNAANSIIIASFQLTDGVIGSPDDDGAPTTIKGITFDLTTTDRGGATVNGAKGIRRIALYNQAGTELGDQAYSGAASVTFNIASALNFITAADNGTTTFTVRVSFNNGAANITDRDNIRLKISNVVQDLGSGFNPVSSVTGGSWTPGTGAVTGATFTPTTANIIDVIATKLDFVTQPGTTAGINEPTTEGTLRANDQQGLKDLEFNFPAAVSATTATVAPGSFTFFEGDLDLDGMQYSGVGNGKLTVTVTGTPVGTVNSNATGTFNSLPNVSNPSGPVDVLHVTTAIATGGVSGSTNLAGGSVDKIIFGITFSAPYTAAGEPTLSSFRISFGNSPSYPLNTIFTNVRVFENTSAAFGGPNITAFGGSVAFDAATKTDLIVTFPTPRSLLTSKSYFLEVDVVSTASGSTPSVTPSVIDGGFSTATNTNIVTTRGSAVSSVSGQTYNFSAIFPPTLVSSYPASGQLNVSRSQPTISLNFSVPVWTLDGKVQLYDGATNALIGDLPLFGSGAGSGEYVVSPASPAPLVNNAPNLGNPIKFVLPGSTVLKDDHVYYVKIKPGVFNGPRATDNVGIMDQAGNLFAGISYSGAVYFKTANPNPPNLLSSPISASDPTISNATITGGVVSAIFDQPGKAFFIVLPHLTTAPTAAEVYSGTHASLLAKGSFDITQVFPNAQSGVITPVSGTLTAGVTYDLWMSAVGYSENDGVLTQIPVAPPLPFGSITKLSKTGTISGLNNSTVITGSTTSFLTQLVPGRTLFEAPGGTTTIGTIASITSNTSLTLTAPPPNNLTGASYLASGFEVGAAGPTLTFVPAPASGSVTLNQPSINICTNTYQTLSQPIVITESVNKNDFREVIPGVQTINLVLPAGFAFDASLTNGRPTYGLLTLNGADFTPETPTSRSGTITTSLTSSSVTGAGTSFSSEFGPGDLVYNSTGVTLIGKVLSITSNTSMVLTSNAALAISGAAYRGANANGNPQLGFVGSAILKVSFRNTGNSSLDNIVISGLRVISTTGTSGPISRFGGNGITQPGGIADLATLATISSAQATGIPFANSYSQKIFLNNIVTTIPDNYAEPGLAASTAQLIPLPPYGDYGPSTFTGSGVNVNILNLTAVSLGAPFNITLNHKDNNGCPSTTFEQYTVYDHATAIADLNIEYCGKNDNFSITNPVSTIPDATEGVAAKLHVVNFDRLQSYYLDDLSADVPPTATLFDPLAPTHLSSDQIIAGSGWKNVLNNLFITKLPGGFNPGNNPVPGHLYYNYRIDEAIILNAKSKDGTVPYSPYAYEYFGRTTANGNIYYTGGSLGIVQFKGIYQSIANANVKIPLLQNVEFFIPAVPIIETSSASFMDVSDPLNPVGTGGPSNKGTPIYCEQGGSIVINAFPAASSGSSTGIFTLYDRNTGTIIAQPYPATTPGFVDNQNGTASIDPTVFKNSYNDIRIEYTYRADDSPCSETTKQMIRISPNPVASFSKTTPTTPYVINTGAATCAGQPINFNSTAVSTDPYNVTIPTFIWDFGDVNSPTNSASIAAPTHTYDNPSNLGADYHVTFRVRSFFGCPSETATVPIATKDIAIGGIPVVKYDVLGISVNDTFTFQSKEGAIGTSVTPNDKIVRYDWDFGDGSPTASVTGLSNDNAFNNFIQPHNYTSIGKKDFDLKVTSNLGCVNSLSLQNSYRSLVVLPRVPLGTSSYVSTFESSDEGWQVWGTGKNVAEMAINSAPGRMSWQWGAVPGAGGPITFDAILNGGKLWKTFNINGDKYKDLEKSALYSPSFDLTNLKRAMIAFHSGVNMEGSDGVVLQFSTDSLNIADPRKKWRTLMKGGQDWYADSGLAGKPGDQASNDFGWGSNSGTNGLQINPRAILDSVHTIQGTVQYHHERVVLRWALGSAKSGVVRQGFTLDNIYIGDRTRTILLENFVSTSNSNPEEKIQNETAAIFQTAGIGTEVVKINYHLNFPGKDPFNEDNPADPSSRALLYNVTKTPRSRLDGENDPQDRVFDKWVNDLYKIRTLQLAQADFQNFTAVSSASGAVTINFDIKSTVFGGIPAQTILHVAILEQTIPASGLSQAQKDMIKSGETTFDYTLKKMLPSAAGTRLGTILPDGVTRHFGPFTWMPNPKQLYPNPNDLAVAVFLQQENAPYEVYQVEVVRSGILDPPVITGLEPVLADAVSVYPVPSNQEMNIQLPGKLAQKANIQLIDQVGRVVHASTIDDGAESKVIRTDDLAAGVYILQLEIGTGNFTRKKIVIAH